MYTVKLKVTHLYFLKGPHLVIFLLYYSSIKLFFYFELIKTLNVFNFIKTCTRITQPNFR